MTAYAIAHLRPAAPHPGGLRVHREGTSTPMWSWCPGVPDGYDPAVTAAKLRAAAG